MLRRQGTLHSEFCRLYSPEVFQGRFPAGRGDGWNRQGPRARDRCSNSSEVWSAEATASSWPELDGLRMQSLVPSSLGVCEWGFAVRKAYEVVSLPGTRRRERDQGWKMKSWISKKY